MTNSRMLNDSTALVTWPVDVWFGGSRTFPAVLDFGGRPIERIMLDPYCRFPDRDPGDNVWPRAATTTAAAPQQAAMPGAYTGRGATCAGGG
jgi:hypothetical protein